jgi:predicted enzyme related to lactoylglutathione lyase
MPNIIRFEIHATKPQVIIDFYSALFGWKFTSVASMGYWRIDTSGSGAPGIDGGLVQRPGLAPAAAETVNAFICRVQAESVEKILGDAVALGAVIALQTMTVRE